ARSRRAGGAGGTLVETTVVDENRVKSVNNRSFGESRRALTLTSVRKLSRIRGVSCADTHARG
ncbi:hypothetical protein, partial [Mycolicibacterium phlei]|uniref:hypothetical protein n=1 Tax=Mycolicibacterium phlei TaxID=1771 RepID=UPI001E646A25